MFFEQQINSNALHLNLFPVVGKDPKKINEEITIFSNELFMHEP